MKLLVLDGNSILNRAFYGIRLLTTKDGMHTNAIYGFLTMFLKVKEEVKPDAVAIAFDRREPTFRHKAFDGYKAKRKGMPDELASQLPVLKELLTLLGYKLLECPGFEADDILGTLAHSCEESGNSCVIATGDKDSLQLISQNVSVRIAATKMGRPEATLYDEAKIMEVFGVKPKQLIDIKALQGDASDNIPGVAGIGQKGATDLIQRFHDIDYIYQNIDTLDIKEGIRKKLIAGKESAYMSKMLGTIRTDAPVDCDPSSYQTQPFDAAAAARFMAKLEFFSLIDKMGLSDVQPDGQEEKQLPDQFQVFKKSDLETLKKIVKKNKKTDVVASYQMDTSAEFLFLIGNDLFMITSLQDGFEQFLRDIFEDNKIKKRTHNSKALFSFLCKKGISCKNLTFDTMLAGYLLNPSASSYELERLAQEYGINFSLPKEDSELLKHGAVFSDLADTMEQKIKENQQDFLLTEIEIPLSEVLAQMELIGFAVDANGVITYGEMLDSKIKELMLLIYDDVGYEFNLNSPKQLGSALFEKLGLPTRKKTKSGYSTNAEVLESLRYAHPVVKRILEFRTLSKLKSTYCDAMQKVISEDGRIHSKFNQVETRTGRISSTDPNLQNIPVRTDVGRELRRFFCAKEGCVLVDADYSQIELRVLAHVAKDQAMIRAFQNNDDIHSITASQVFHMPPDMLTPLMRSRAKAVNFGIVYGIGAFSLAKDIGVTRKEADHYIKEYLSHYSGVDRYMKEVVALAKEQGFVETIFHRRRYLPELTSSNFNLRSFGERVARNMPIQGTAADIIKIAMIRVHHRLQKEKMKSRLILQVHDELIVEAPKEEAEKAAVILREEMEGSAKLTVPLVAEASIGETWYDAKK